MTAYYNEINKHAAQWLRNLIAKGLIAPGDVDERSILEVKPDDLKSYTQCHFFAGIGGWSHAMRLAGWPDDRSVWTGSCPCQPFSAAGKQRGSDDERHLWPAFFYLIRERGPASVFGEQVAGAAGLAWLDHVCADLEGAGYAAAAADLPACSVGAPHRRQRLFWVAQSDQGQRGPWRPTPGRQERAQPQFAGSGDFDGVADDTHVGRREERQDSGRQREGDCAQGWSARLESSGDAGWLANADGWDASAERQQCGRQQRQQPQDGGTSILGDTGDTGDTGLARSVGVCGIFGGASESGAGKAAERTSLHLDAWADLEWINCSDGKARPTQPGLFPLAHGVSNRVGRLRAYGNAIVPQVAAAFVMANAEISGERSDSDGLPS